MTTKIPVWTEEMKAKATATRATTKARKEKEKAELTLLKSNPSNPLVQSDLENPQGEESAVTARPKVAAKFKSPELQVFEQSGKIAAGRPAFTVYKKERGAYWYVGPCETNTAEEVGELYGGGKFEIRTVNQASGFEEVGPDRSFTVAIHPSSYPEIIAPVLKAAPEDVISQDEIEEAKAEGKKEAAREAEIEMLRKRLLEPIQNQAPLDPMAMLIKMMEFQKLSAPAPEIGPKRSIAEIAVEAIAGIGAAVTAGLGLYKTLRTEFKPTSVPEAAAGIGEKMLLGLVENLMTKGAAAQASNQSQAEAPAVTEKDQTEMLQELAMELAKQQGLEANTKQDTVIPMASWILSQTGIVWGMLKKNIQDSDPKQVVAFVAAQMPSLADTEFKMKWLSQVVEVVKNPALAQPKVETEGK